MEIHLLLDVVRGDFDSGFQVRLRISDHEEFELELPSDPEIPKLYDQWREFYREWSKLYQQRLDFPDQVTNPCDPKYEKSKQDCKDVADALENRLQEWFDQPKLRDLREHIVLAAQQYHISRLIVRADDYYLRRLPWHLWPLLERLDNLEIVISNQTSKKSSQLSNPVQILCVLGNSQGIDTQTDFNLLNTLPHAIVHRLVEPTLGELQDHLYKRWDILFFAGHSHSEDNDNGGVIWLNPTTQLSLGELKNEIKNAGLKIAIFNSCDGLGLAQELADLQIPYLIVMREPVPDQIAQKFLEYFLIAFAQEEPFHLAVQQARKRLRSLERIEPNYLCASWLPIICQNPAAPVLIYPSYNPYKITLIRIGGIIALVVMGMIFYRLWQEWIVLARISLGEKVLVTEVTNTDKVAGTNAFRRGDFDRAANYWQNSLKKYPNDPETRIYLENAQIGSRPAWKIAVSVPIGTNPDVAQEMLRGVAQSQDAVNHSKDKIHGLPLQVEIANDDNKPDVAIYLAKQFIKDPQILAVVGHNASDTSVAAGPTYDQGGLVMITPTSFSDNLSSMGHYIFRMVPSIRFMADKLADYYITNNPYAKIAICSDRNVIDKESFVNQFSNEVSNQAATHPHLTLDKSLCDFSAKSFDSNVIIKNLIKRGVDTLLLAPHVDRISKAIDIARANHKHLKLLGSPTLYTSTTLELGQEAVNGLLLVAPWYPNLFHNSFSDKATKLWGGQVNWRTAMSYDATEAIVAGLKQITGTGVRITSTREKLKDALQNPDFFAEGASGIIRFTQSGERQVDSNIDFNFGMVQVKPAPASLFYYDFVSL